MTFGECVLACAKNREFVDNTDRLRGTSFGAAKDPLTAAIDAATGFDEAQAVEFAAIVYELVWSRLTPTTDS